MSLLNYILTLTDMSKLGNNIYVTSINSCVSDADISLGSTTFGTDNLAALQVILDYAQTKPITIIVDGQYSISGVLKVYSNTHIIGLNGCGVILRNASNTGVFENANLAHAANITSVAFDNIIDENITIENLIINQNGYNTGPGGSDVFDVANNGSAVNGSAQTKRNVTVNMIGVRNLIFKDVQALGGRYYVWYISNVENAYFENITTDFGESSDRDEYNYDGFDLHGMVQNVRINGITIRNAKDDNISLNAHSQLDILIDDIGFIKDVIIENVFLDSKSMGIGIYSETSASRVDNIHIKNVTGSTDSHFLRITNGETVSPEGTGDIGTIIIENCDVDVVGTNNLQDYDAHIHIRASIEKLILKNLIRKDFTRNNSYIKLSKAATSSIKELIIVGVIQQSSGGTFAKPFLEVAEGTINKCVVSNYIHREETSFISAPVVLVNGGTVGGIIMTGINLANINSIISHTSGTLTEILAAAISHFNSGSASFVTAGTVARLRLSNYVGTTATSGTFTDASGDAIP